MSLLTPFDRVLRRQMNSEQMNFQLTQLVDIERLNRKMVLVTKLLSGLNIPIQFVEI